MPCAGRGGSNNSAKASGSLRQKFRGLTANTKEGRFVDSRKRPLFNFPGCSLTLGTKDGILDSGGFGDGQGSPIVLSWRIELVKAIRPARRCAAFPMVVTSYPAKLPAAGPQPFAVCRRPRKCGMTPPRQSNKYEDGLLAVVRVEAQPTKWFLHKNLGFVELTQCWIGS
jgi:hypothetical protein